MAALPAGDIVGGAVGAGAGWSYNTGSCPKSCLWYARIFVPPIHQREKLKRTCCLQIRAAGPPQSVIDRVLDAHDPRIAAVRTLQRYQRSGGWERVPAEHEPKPAGSESEPTAARSTESERGARRRGSRSSFTSSASSQTGSDSEPVTRSSFTESETESESETSVSTDSEDGAVHPAVQEAADSMWLKMKLDGGQRARTPSQTFAAAREILAMPDRPTHLRLEEEAALLCPIMNIDTDALDRLLKHKAKEREMRAERNLQRRTRRGEDKTKIKELRGLRDEIDEAIGCGDLKKVVALQEKVANAEREGISVTSLAGAMEVRAQSSTRRSKKVPTEHHH